MLLVPQDIVLLRIVIGALNDRIARIEQAHQSIQDIDDETVQKPTLPKSYPWHYFRLRDDDENDDSISKLQR